jgi:hypothetical protein
MRKSSLYLVLAAITGNAHAVHLNPNGLGQVLVSPYYTVNAGLQTQISIANRSDNGKALKLRFREGANGRAVADVNVYLAPHDVWTAAVFSPAADAAAHLVTADDSCTVPAIRTSTSLPQLPNGRRLLPFSNTRYSGAGNDAGEDGLARTREGYFEIIEMGEVINAAQRSLNDISPGGDGIPANCARIESAWGQGGYWSQNPTVDITAPTGGIAASIFLVDALDGSMHAYQPEAIDEFSHVVQHTAPGDAAPNLSTATAAAGRSDIDAVVDVAGLRRSMRYPVERAIDAVSALFMAETISNQFVTANFVGGNSAWVVSLPTKPFYTDEALLSDGAPIEPFTKTFAQSIVQLQQFDALGEVIRIDMRAREGGNVSQVCILDPVPVCELVAPTLRWNTNILVFDSNWPSPDSMLESGLSQTIYPPAYSNIAEGWVSLQLYGVWGIESSRRHLLHADLSGYRLVGLPAIGIGLTSYTNGELTPGVLSNYAESHRHRSTARRVLNTPSVTVPSL